MSESKQPEMHGMSRAQLVCEHFDAYSDLFWAQHLVPRFGCYHLGPDAMRDYREAWHAYIEMRDWQWWQDHVKNWPDEKLQGEIAECRERINALGQSQPAYEQCDAARPTFRDILSQYSGQPGPDLTQTQTRSNHR
jgi:hypothetical protein